MDFQRARSEEQREHRRRAILDTTATMLTEMSVASLSLNELARRVGLAKSNVLRYFESREEILLDLLDVELQQWITALGEHITVVDGGVHARRDAVASAIAASLVERPILCELISSQAAVLERNISTDVALRHKRAATQSAEQLATIVAGAVPELSHDATYQVVVITLLMTSAAWPHSRPSAALQAAYDADPAIAGGRMSMHEVLATTIAVQITGLLAQG